MEASEFVAKHFPECDPGVHMMGPRILVQLQYVPEKSKGGIIMPEEAREFTQEHAVVGRVIQLGELAYRNRDTAVRWPEGVWCKPGDLVMAPKYGGMRFNRLTPDGKAVKFIILQDHEIISLVTGQFSQLDTVL